MPNQWAPPSEFDMIRGGAGKRVQGQRVIRSRCDERGRFIASRAALKRHTRCGL